MSNSHLFDKEEVWKEFSRQHKARFSEGAFDMRVAVKLKEWEIVLETYAEPASGLASTTYTRVWTVISNPEKFKFIIYNSDFISEIATLFGMQDIVIGVPDLDVAYIIKGNDEGKIRKVFSKPSIASLLSAIPQVYLAIKDDVPGGNTPDTSLLYFQVPGSVSNPDHLKQIYELFTSVLLELGNLSEEQREVD